MNVFRYVKVSTRETRISVSILLCVPKSRTKYHKRSLRISTAILWNRLQIMFGRVTALLF